MRARSAPSGIDIPAIKVSNVTVNQVGIRLFDVRSFEETCSNSIAAAQTLHVVKDQSK